ncbi:MAG: MFS transporter [Methyloligellaceae bacterium]
MNLRPRKGAGSPLSSAWITGFPKVLSLPNQLSPAAQQTETWYRTSASAKCFAGNGDPMNMHSGKRRGLILATCCGAHALQDGLMGLQSVLLPVLAQAFGLGYAQVGIIRAVSRSATTLLEIPSGMLAERTGERRLLVFGLVCGGLGYLTLTWAGGFVAVLLALFLTGIGAAFQHSLSSSIISKTYEGSGRRSALGTYNSSGDVGKLTYSGLFTLLIGMGVAWQGIVVGVGVTALLGAVAVLVILRHLDVGEGPPRPADARKAPANPGWGVRDRMGFTSLAVIVFLDIAVQDGFLTFLAFLMIEKEVPTSLAVFAVVLTLAGGVFGKFGCGFLAERFGVIRSLVLVECLTAAGIVAVLLSPTLLAYFLLPAVGLVLQGSSSITYGTVSDLVSGDRQSRGFAAIYSIAYGAAVVAPIVFGLIGDWYGLAPAMLTMACIALLPLPLCLLLQPALARSAVT